MTHPTDSEKSWLTIRKALGELPNEIPPKRDLWSGVAERIAHTEQENTGSLVQADASNLEKIAGKKSILSQGQSWMPVAVAASLLVAVGSMLFSWHTWSQYSSFIEQQQVQYEQQTMLNLLDNHHRLSKASFLQKLEQQSVDIDPAVVADLINNIVVIEQALQEIKSALIHDPGNEKLLALLKRTYEQQDTLISQTQKNYRTI